MVRVEVVMVRVEVVMGGSGYTVCLQPLRDHVLWAVPTQPAPSSISVTHGHRDLGHVPPIRGTGTPGVQE